jgi:hypothetical protein
VSLDIREELDSWIDLDDDPAVTATCRRARASIARAEAYNLSLMRHLYGLIATVKKAGAPDAATLLYICELMLREALEAAERAGAADAPGRQTPQ